MNLIMSHNFNTQSPPLILVADDFDAIRKWIAINLKRKGYIVLEASNGKEAVELAKETLPDLIIMDLEMPVMDGFSAMTKLREMNETRNVPVIACSSHDADGYRKESFAAGCTDFTMKSADTSELEEKIDSLLS